MFDVYDFLLLYRCCPELDDAVYGLISGYRSSWFALSLSLSLCLSLAVFFSCSFSLNLHKRKSRRYPAVETSKLTPDASSLAIKQYLAKRKVS